MILKSENGVGNNNFTTLLINSEEAVTVDGVNGVFTDSSKLGRNTITASFYGMGIINKISAIKKFGTYSWYTTANTSLYKDTGFDFNAKNNPFTIDFWAYGESVNSYIKLIFGDSVSSTLTKGISLGYADTPTGISAGIHVYNDGESLELSTEPLNVEPYNQWHHFAFVRTGGRTAETDLYYFFKDGLLEISSQWKSNFPEGGNIDFSGGVIIYPKYTYTDEVRITKGKALWTRNFTPPNRAS